MISNVPADRMAFLLLVLSWLERLQFHGAIADRIAHCRWVQDGDMQRQS